MSRRFGFSLAQLFLIVALAGLVFSLCRQLWLLRLYRARRLSYSVYSVAFSPDGRLLAIGTDGLKLWDVASERIVFETVQRGAPRWRNGAWDLAGETIVETAPYIVSVAFSPDGKTLATTHSQMSPGTRLWDVATKQLVAAYDGRIMAAVAFSPDGNRLASAYHNKRLFAQHTQRQAVRRVRP